MPVEFGALVLKTLGGLLAAGASILTRGAADEISALLKNRRVRQAFEGALNTAHDEFDREKRYSEFAGALLDRTYLKSVAPELHKLIRSEGEPDLDFLVKRYAGAFGRTSAPEGAREALEYLVDCVKRHVYLEEDLRDLLDSRNRRITAVQTKRTADGVQQVAGGVQEAVKTLKEI